MNLGFGVPNLYLERLHALKEPSALLDERGRIVAVNARWHSAKPFGVSIARLGSGFSDLIFEGQEPKDGLSRANEIAASGVRAVLEGSLPQLSLSYTVESESGRTEIQLQVTAVQADLRRWTMVTQRAETSLGQFWSMAAALSDLASANHRLEAENLYLQEEVRKIHHFDEIVAGGAGMKKVLRQIEQVSPTNASVLITGETGTGKELIARAIHARSAQRQRPIVKVNCAALPDTLIESELFGHEKGAFTGALSRMVGRFELAHNGTIFLDEAGDLPLQLQAKLLRVLQEGEFERLGSTSTIRVNVRVIAATNRNLAEMVKAGAFRTDLFYRLNVFPIHVPSLRERKEMIPELVWYFVAKYQELLGRRVEIIPKAAMNALISYGWPGNVRELENQIQRALILSPGRVLMLDDSWTKAVPNAPPVGCENLAATERAHIIAILEATGWKLKGKNNAAQRLGLNPSTLRSRMKKLGIHRRSAQSGPDDT
jgi:transcriptional regulator with GAF, ATPase, and Fis domain